MIAIVKHRLSVTLIWSPYISGIWSQMECKTSRLAHAIMAGNAAATGHTGIGTDEYQSHYHQGLSVMHSPTACLYIDMEAAKKVTL